MKEESGKAGLKFNIQKTNIMASGPIWGKIESSDRFYFLGFPKSLQTVTAAMNEKMLDSWKESFDKSRHNITKQRHHFASKGPYCESYIFSSSHVRVVNGC